MKNVSALSFDEPVIDRFIEDYFRENEAARTFAALAEGPGWPLVIDHVAFRCLDIDRRAAPFLERGYRFEDETVRYPDQGWWAKVYRKPGLPALFIDQAYEDKRGTRSIIPQWVEKFGEDRLHHVAVLVDDIDRAKALMEKSGVAFSGSIVGNPGSRLRQIFTASEIRDGEAYTVLELTERNGYEGFYHEQADRLMQSSIKKQSE